QVDLPAGADRPYALTDVSFDLHEGRILCVVGESGSGKSMTAGAIMGLLPPDVRVSAGRMLFQGEDLSTFDEEAMRKVRGARIGMIFQEPMTALNPLQTIGDQVGEMYRTHTTLGKAEIRERVHALLADVHIPDPQKA